MPKRWLTWCISVCTFERDSQSSLKTFHGTVKRPTSSLFNSIWHPMIYVIYFTGRKSVSYFGFGGKVAFCASNTPLFSREDPQNLPPSNRERPLCVSVTITTLRSAIHYSLFPASIPPSSNGIVVFLHATTGGLLPTICKGSSTLKRLYQYHLWWRCHLTWEATTTLNP